MYLFILENKKEKYNNTPERYNSLRYTYATCEIMQQTILTRPPADRSLD